MKRFIVPPLLALALALASPMAVAEKLPPVKHLIDTHIHLYDTTREVKVTWPKPDDTVLYKPHLPTEYSKLAKEAGVTGVVIVEASLRLEDNDWILDLVKDDDFYVGLVGNIDIYREDFEKHLLRLKKDRRFVGIRVRSAGKVDYTDGIVLMNLTTLAKHGMSMDYLTNGGGIPGIAAINGVARRIPNLRIVVDHALGYDFDGKAPPAKWIAAVERLAANENVYCKISGLYQRCSTQPAVQDPAHYRAVLDVLWKNFGKTRLVYGSNWPCTKNTGSYASFLKLVEGYFADKGQDAREHYFWKNAAEAYRLPLN